MDKTKEYEEIRNWILSDLADVSKDLQALRDELFYPMLSEKDEKVPQTTQEEVLRKYIQLSRDIQSEIFNLISTHVLTIERLADHILCRRAAVKRMKKPGVEPVTTTNDLGPAFAAQLKEITKDMTVEQLQAYIAKLKGE